jgi:hypothetical protein
MVLDEIQRFSFRLSNFVSDTRRDLVLNSPDQVSSSNGQSNIRAMGIAAGLNRDGPSQRPGEVGFANRRGHLHASTNRLNGVRFAQ